MNTQFALPLHSSPIPTLGSELLTDPGLETWTDATHLTNWGCYTTGGSTINREATTIHGGSYSCRFDVNAANDAVYITQAWNLAAGKLYRLTFWYNIPTVNKSIYLSLTVTAPDGQYYYLTRGSWFSTTWQDCGVYYNTPGWMQVTLEFRAPWAASYTLTVSRNDLISTSAYIDDFSLKEITYVSAQPDLVAAWRPTSVTEVTNLVRASIGESTPIAPYMSGEAVPATLEITTDPGLEVWTDATTLTNWTKTLSGTSTLNREASFFDGVYSARIDIDASNNAAYANQGATLIIGRKYRLSFWYKNSVGAKTLAVQLINGSGNVYLKDDGTWGTTAGTSLIPANNTSWTKYSIDFVNTTIYTSFLLYFGAGTGFTGSSAASSSCYFDRFSLQDITFLGPELLYDGGLERWTDATHLVDWLCGASGSSSVNRAASPHGGIYCVRLDSDASANYAVFRTQYASPIQIIPGRRYKISFWYKMSASPGRLGLYIYASPSTNPNAPLYLMDDGKTWGSGGHQLIDNKTAWTKFDFEFPGPPPLSTAAGYTDFIIYFTNHTDAISISLYVDDITLKEVIAPQALKPIQTQTRPNIERVIDGGLEVWSSATDLTNWTEALSGSSTVNRESTTIHGGTYSCRFWRDAGTASCYITQAVTLKTGTKYRLSFWINAPNGSNEWCYLAENPGWQLALNNLGAWGNGYGILTTGTGAWQQVTIEFINNTPFTSFVLLLGGGGTASTNTYVDDVSLIEMPPQAQEQIGWKFDGIDDFITIKGAPANDYPFSSGWTAIAWINPSENRDSRIIMRSTIPTFIYTDPTNHVRAYWGTSGTAAYALTTNSIAVNTWTYVTVVFNPTTVRFSIYFNGVLQSLSIDTAGTGTLNQSSANPTTIGGDGSFFKGYITLPSIIARVLDVKEILNMFNAAKHMFYPR